MDRYFDLSPTLWADFPTHPGQDPVTVDRFATVQRDGFQLERMNITSHTGAHVDAPAHLVQNGKTIDEFEIEDFVGPTATIDLRDKRENEPITAADLEKKAPAIDAGSIVLLLTGWSRNRSKSDGYVHRSPYLTPEASEWLARKQVKGVAVDHFTVGTTDRDTDRAAHLPLLSVGIWILEDLDIPEELLEYDDLTLYAAPVKLEKGSGAQARPFVVARTEDARPGYTP